MLQQSRNRRSGNVGVSYLKVSDWFVCNTFQSTREFCSMIHNSCNMNMRALPNIARGLGILVRLTPCTNHPSRYHCSHWILDNIYPQLWVNSWHSLATLSCNKWTNAFCKLCSTCYTAVRIKNCLKSTSVIKVVTMKTTDNIPLCKGSHHVRTPNI